MNMNKSCISLNDCYTCIYDSEFAVVLQIYRTPKLEFMNI